MKPINQVFCVFIVLTFCVKKNIFVQVHVIVTVVMFKVGLCIWLHSVVFFAKWPHQRRDSIPGPLGMVVADISNALSEESALARTATMPPQGTSLKKVLYFNCLCVTNRLTSLFKVMISFFKQFVTSNTLTFDWITIIAVNF